MLTLTLCTFHDNRVVLQLDPTFIPKVNSLFHRSQDVVLPDFCPAPSQDRERLWHQLDVKRALRIYLRHTEHIRKSEAFPFTHLPWKKDYLLPLSEGGSNWPSCWTMRPSTCRSHRALRRTPPGVRPPQQPGLRKFRLLISAGLRPGPSHLPLSGTTGWMPMRQQRRPLVAGFYNR